MFLVQNRLNVFYVHDIASKYGRMIFSTRQFFAYLISSAYSGQLFPQSPLGSFSPQRRQTVIGHMWADMIVVQHILPDIIQSLFKRRIAAFGHPFGF